MTPVLGGVAAVVGVVVIVWLVAGGARLIRRGYFAIRERLRRVFRRSHNVQHVDLAERDWIYNDRPARRAPGASGASASEGAPESIRPGTPVAVLDPGAAAILRHAEMEAAAIVKRAEQRAHEILAAAEAERTRLEQEAARQRALAAEERTKLTAFLSEVLEEVQHGGIGTVRDLSKLRELKKRAGGNDDRQAGSSL
jgi:hypothetical protein